MRKSLLFTESTYNDFHFTAAIPELFAAVGGKVSLPCNTSIPAGGDGVSLILWYHGDFGIPIYSLDARDQPLGKARHFPGPDLGTRAYLDVASKPPTLNIDPVLESDAGQYRCRVDYSRQRTQHRNVNLTVIGRPPPAVTWWRGPELVDESYALSPLDVVRNELVIKRLQRSDLLATYTCQASNTNLTMPRSSSVTINMNREYNIMHTYREELRLLTQ
ncbi:hypothetical protein HPB48_007253 [Haemaphysalis longicornis]|uniref:Ig-like domain-containing protein n=1 Tax=Haemaphysalis longicornis TaxID=44386 RepID=A0A9J6G2C9_HAELO|nr:hypothetical protein HPB48_007253 [Haemaphysalis longicornis]